MLRPVIKTHGGKWYLKDWIISNFPKNYTFYLFLECFVGGGSIILNKKPSEWECISDLNFGLSCIYKILQDDPTSFIEKLSELKYDEQTFESAKTVGSLGIAGELGVAVHHYVLCRMSRGGLGKSFAWSDRFRGGIPGDINGWLNSIKQLPKVAERLKDVLINPAYNALDILPEYNHSKIFTFLDPPYLHSSRVSKNAYKHEMSEQDHIRLGEILNGFKGKVLLSGYNSPLYDQLYKGWNKIEKEIVNHASQQKVKPLKIEVLFKNY